MPELPEVEFARGCLERWLVGERVQARAPASRVLRGSSPDAFAALSNRVLETVERRGKWLLATFEGRRGLLIHLGMTGKLVRATAGERVRWSRAELSSARHVVHLRDPRMFGRLVPGPVDRLLADEALVSLGPDAWGSPPTGAGLKARLGASRRAIKDALLDQSVIAGLGNIQVTEALFAARIHPSRIARELDRRACDAIMDGVRASLERTLAMNGGDEIQYVEEPGAPNPFVIYGRTGEPCPRCADTIARLVIGGRTSAFCPTCQRLPKRSRG